jgi:RNA binding exosome subunit
MGCCIINKFYANQVVTASCSPYFGNEINYLNMRLKKKIVKMNPGTLRTILEVKPCHEVSFE